MVVLIRDIGDIRHHLGEIEEIESAALAPTILRGGRPINNKQQ